LAQLLETELRLLAEHRYEELTPLDLARSALLATLPAVAPASARRALERCAALNAQVRDELQRARSATLAALAEVRRGQRAARGYAPFRRRPPRVSTNA
jgi:hypothetical protein